MWCSVAIATVNGSLVMHVAADCTIVPHYVSRSTTLCRCGSSLDHVLKLLATTSSFVLNVVWCCTDGVTGVWWYTAPQVCVGCLWWTVEGICSRRSSLICLSHLKGECSEVHLPIAVVTTKPLATCTSLLIHNTVWPPLPCTCPLFVSLSLLHYQ